MSGSTLVRKLNAGDRAGAAAEFPRWNKSGGERSKGLIAGVRPSGWCSWALRGARPSRRAAQSSCSGRPPVGIGLLYASGCNQGIHSATIQQQANHGPADLLGHWRPREHEGHGRRHACSASSTSGGRRVAVLPYRWPTAPTLRSVRRPTQRRRAMAAPSPDRAGEARAGQLDDATGAHSGPFGREGSRGRDLSGTQPVSGTVAVTGVATAALQGTGNTSLSSIDTKSPALSTGAVPVETIKQRWWRDSSRQRASSGASVNTSLTTTCRRISIWRPRRRYSVCDRIELADSQRHHAFHRGRRASRPASASHPEHRGAGRDPDHRHAGSHGALVRQRATRMGGNRARRRLAGARGRAHGLVLGPEGLVRSVRYFHAFARQRGTTPVAAAGDGIGRILDKSGAGNHATQTPRQVDRSGRRPTQPSTARTIRGQRQASTSPARTR